MFAWNSKPVRVEYLKYLFALCDFSSPRRDFYPRNFSEILVGRVMETGTFVAHRWPCIKIPQQM
jgi:hypothetical protein